MTGRIYDDMRSTVLPPDPAPLTRKLHTLGVYEARVLALGELFDDAQELLGHVLDDRDLAAVGPCALAAGASMADVARVLGRWVEMTMAHERVDEGLAARVRAAIALTQSTAPDGDLAFFVSRELIGARATAGYALAVAAGHAVSLVGRRALVGAGSPAELAGELVQLAVVRQHGEFLARVPLDELVAVARAAFAEDERAGEPASPPAL